MLKYNCSYCGKPIRKHSWISMFSSNEQCDRLLCRIKTGYFLWMYFHRRIIWKSILSIPIFTTNLYKEILK